MKPSRRRRLKQDPYIAALARLAAWARAHRKPLIAGLAAAGLAALMVLWLRASRLAAEAAARDLLAEVDLQAQAVLFEKPERRPAAIQDLLRLCDSVAEDYSHTSAAPLALLRAAQVLVRVGRAEEAVPYFERAAALARPWPGLLAQTRRGLAEALEESGQVRKAIPRYEQLAQDAGPTEQAHAFWDLGRCYEALGEKERAVEFYRKAVNLGAGSMWQELAGFRLNWLLEAKSASAAGSRDRPPAARGGAEGSSSDTGPAGPSPGSGPGQDAAAPAPR